jgi:hypothetical protein
MHPSRPLAAAARSFASLRRLLKTGAPTQAGCGGGGAPATAGPETLKPTMTEVPWAFFLEITFVDRSNPTCAVHGRPPQRGSPKRGPMAFPRRPAGELRVATVTPKGPGADTPRAIPVPRAVPVPDLSGDGDGDGTSVPDLPGGGDTPPSPSPIC